MRHWKSVCLAAIALCGFAHPCPAQEPASLADTVQLPDARSRTPEPGLAYGAVPDLPLPKTIMFSTTPDEIIADAEEWARRGVQAFFLDRVIREPADDIWAADGKPSTIGASDEMFQKVREATALCRRIDSEVFLKVAFDNCFEWFNDTSWQRLNNNFRQIAIFARDTGCHGIALDIEYVGEQYDYDWRGYTYDGYTRPGLARKIAYRMTGALATLYDEFPDMVFLTFPEQGLGLGSYIHTAWIEEAARRNAPGGMHYCLEGTYQVPNARYVFAHTWLSNDLMHRLLSETARTYWREKCSIAPGIWPLSDENTPGKHYPHMTLEGFRQGCAAGLMAARRYNWIYSHHSRDLLIGRDTEPYTGDAPLQAYLDVIANREAITSPQFVALARELRSLENRDFSGDLALLPTPRIITPRDVITLDAVPLDAYGPGQWARLWDLGLRAYRGEKVNLKQALRTQTHWLVIGPFENDEHWSGHTTAYPPESAIDLNATYNGLEGPVCWTPYEAEDGAVAVDFKTVYAPTDRVCAYGLCYVTSPVAQDVYIRLGTNDYGKLWVGGRLVFDYPQEGWAMVDEDIIPVTLPAGTTPILVKACNGQGQWGFVFRITDPQGAPLDNLRFSLTPPGRE